ncbi:hypothetical protein QBC33DRAFT_72511 [Phialemonium atrogriseum]|uniref:Uncharacterized protein n=1 Tax=Phialemonium atrogriseum TaxID=1093897 RepID=A0AAJ0C0T1_9PEZI|nr:uncharacterized protein QBC33DRAFT_72511 [Phialemonium atrogriseum]KAK1766983.1 hypothetical protein QBC33DRAFT_72511 [Phialemonium atrogriseum]
MAGNSTDSGSEPGPTGIASWFPHGKGGWQFDVVTLLAVIGESSVAEHSQAITASFLCLLPRIIPAPQAMLKPSRPGRMPDVTAKLAGVYSGVVLDTVGFFANIIQPIDQLPPYSFRMLEIRHKDPNEAAGILADPTPASARGPVSSFRNLFRRTANEIHHSPAQRHGGGRIPGPPPLMGQESTAMNEKGALRSGTLATGASVGIQLDPERGGEPAPPQPGIVRRRTVHEKMTDYLANPTLANNAARPAVPATLYSPVHVLSLLSFLLTVGLIVCAAVVHDGTAIVAIALVSLAGSVVGYASWWRPILMRRSHTNKVPKGDVVIRTREGAFVLVRCTEEVARELYLGTEECEYYVKEPRYKALMGLGTVLLMVAVVLLGNCDFFMQVAVSASYVALNGFYWAMGLLPKEYFWDLSRYCWQDTTPDDASNAHGTTDEDDPREGAKSFTRTLWYVIRETKRTGWVERSGAAPGTPQWREWLREAEAAARRGDRRWAAVAQKDEIMKADEPPDTSDELQGSSRGRRRGDDRDSDGGGPATDEAAQHAPVQEVQGKAGRANQGSF